jgi:hypothetical protein
MAQQSINVGTTANDKKGDSLRAAFQKVNNNFTELYASTPNVPTDISDLTDNTGLLSVIDGGDASSDS